MATETERFAELMRGFKERSGRSYGTLAKRLHSSNSTLHRYCSGAAVPTDYAPVERFARVCGASADELLALHQQWLLALVERRRGVTEGQASGSGAANSAAPLGGDAAPEVPAASAAVVVAGEASEVLPQAETDPAPAPASAAGSAQAPGPAAAEVSAPAPTPAPAPAPAEAPAPAPATETPAHAPAARIQPGPARAFVPGARRPRLLLAVAAAVATAAVAGTAAAVSAMGDTGRGDTRHGAAQPSSRERTAAGPALPSGGSSSPTPPAVSAPPSSPGPSSTSATSAPTSATSAPTSQATAKEGASPTAPFTVNVLPDNWDSPCDQWFALDKAPGTVPPPPAGQATEGWARALDAVPAGHLRMQLTVQGTEGKAAVLHALYVHVVSGRKAPGWNAYTMGAGCGGALVPASFAVDLDDASPRARPVPGKEGERPTASTDFPYKVSATDPQVLNIDAATLGQDVSWYLELAWSSGDRKGTTRIDDHGRPFRTVALNAGHSYWYNANNNAWLPYTE
ncbi:helix-turn-helix transcriptional regulator [Streptomyces sp. NBC_00091]|uniref:helix-turn-helix domain-containing protein n=1 Tax=Streptomyces sp. NBC_00091 TaxID=2975648 RepID=UPI00225B8A4B|nr:helix-turn-helix transcriptional regulator [Streptomyces sp. NBC_00091]MCX5377405.1 helix-turn-helix domain-containing protein [Streptomyces sp. NBC_00091]